MANEKLNTSQKVWQIVEPYANELELDIWDIKFVKEGASYFLRIFIDKPEGITLDDCEAFSRAIDAPLDEADPIKESYYLEVSSPGLGRELTLKKHFEAVLGEEIRVLLIRPKDGIRNFEGVLLKYENSTVFLEDSEGNTQSFAKSEISKVCLNDDKNI